MPMHMLTTSPPPPPETNTYQPKEDTDKDGVADHKDIYMTESAGTMVGTKDPKMVEEPIININIDEPVAAMLADGTKVAPVDKYSTGLIAYKVPKVMEVGESYLIKIRITRENNVTLLIVGDRKIPIADEGNSVVNIESISISPIMSANLYTTKGAFKIDTLATEYQNISTKGYTEWAWNVIPLKGGNNLLKLSVKIRVKENGESYYKDIVVFDKKIHIKSNIAFSLTTWLATYWQYLLTVILLPFIKWAYDEYKKRKNTNEGI
jgi:hypothetical protein